MAGPLARLYATLGLDARDFMGGIKQVQSTVDRLGGPAAAIGTAVGTALGTASIAALRFGESYDEAVDAIRIGTGAIGAELSALEADFKAVAGSVPDDIGLVGQVIADLNKRTGQTGEGLRALGETILDLSRITNTDAVGNVALATRVFGDWSIATDEQAESLDELFRAAQATGIGVDQLMSTVVQFGAPLRALGMSFEESIALLGKWEQEGVNIETVLAGLRMAVANFAKAGIDPSVGLPALVEEIGNLDDAQGLLRAKQIVGQSAANDFFRAVREGRFDVADLVGTIEDGSDTIGDATRDTEGLGEAWRTFKNIVATTVGPITDDLSGIATEMGNLVFLLPAIGGALGNALGRVWSRLGGPAVHVAVRAAGAAAGLVYTAAAFVASKFVSAAVALWGLVGGSRVVAAASAAGTTVGAAFAGAASAGGLLGRAASLIATGLPMLLRALPPVAVAVAIAWVIKEPLNDFLDRTFGEVGKEMSDFDAAQAFTAEAVRRGYIDLGGSILLDPATGQKITESVRQSIRDHLWGPTADGIEDDAASIGETVASATADVGRYLAQGGQTVVGAIRRTAQDITAAAASVGSFGQMWDGLTEGIDPAIAKLESRLKMVGPKSKDAILSARDSVGQAMDELRWEIRNPMKWARTLDDVESKIRNLGRKALAAAQSGNARLSGAYSRAQIRIIGIWEQLTGKAWDYAKSWNENLARGQRQTRGKVVGEAETSNRRVKGKLGNTRGIEAGGEAIGSSWMQGIIDGIGDLWNGFVGILEGVRDRLGGSLPEAGPLVGVEQGGASLAQAWGEGLLGQLHSVRRDMDAEMAGMGRTMADIEAPRFTFDSRRRDRMGLATEPDGGTGEVHIHVHGNVYGGDAGLRQLQREIDRALRISRRERGYAGSPA